METSPVNLVPDGTPSPERLAQNVELRRQMERALDALSQAERTAFVMRHWEGCGIEEIAEALNSSASAAKNTVFRVGTKAPQHAGAAGNASGEVCKSNGNKIMNHPNEEELIAYHGESDAQPAAAIAAHLNDCENAARNLNAFECGTCNGVERSTRWRFPTPARTTGNKCGKEISREARIAPRAREGARREITVAWRRLVFAAAVDRGVRGYRFGDRWHFSLAAERSKNNCSGSGERRQHAGKSAAARAVGEHLGRSEMMLMELSNTSAQSGAGKMIDISAEQKRAEDLLEENRLYRQTALEQGDAGAGQRAG